MHNALISSTAPRGAQFNHGHTEDDFLTSNQVRQEFGGISAMALWRWQQDESLGFPKPTKIRARNYWARGDIRRFKIAQSLKKEAA